MKVLIVSSFDINGGAARAAYRLHKSLLSAEVDSKMLVQEKYSDEFLIKGLNTKIKKMIGKVRLFLDGLPVKLYKYRTKTLFSANWVPFSDIVKRINDENPDVVHLHWINAGMMRIEDIEKIKAPVVWSLHDMWPFTGGCHYDEGCGAFRQGCGACKVLGSQKTKDLSAKVFERKHKIFLRKNINIVGLSKWINNCSQESTLFKDKRHINLPNPIDLSLFKPFDKKGARALWSFPENKKLILFGAMGATSDPRKGFKDLSDALPKLNSNDIEFVVFGSSEPEKSQSFGFKTHYLGHLHDDVSLVALYSAVDVMVVPSLQENLSNAIMESLACGTPVVAFDIGGNSDMIDHKENGYLAKPFESQDLAKGIDWVLQNEKYQQISHNAREKVVQCFDSGLIAEKYIELYKTVIYENLNQKST